MKKYLTLVASFVLVAALAVGGTLAYLTAQSEVITNTFTVGNVNIALAETKTDFKMVPGCTIGKDPVVTVEAGSEDSWVFVEVKESDNLDDFIAYTVDPSNWKELEGYNDIYYTFSKDIQNDRDIKVLLNNQVTVNSKVTKADMDALVADDPTTKDVNESTYPTLTFTAYAVQMAGFDTAKAAWDATFGKTETPPATP